MTVNRTNYFILVVLALLFALPGLVAILFYAHPQWLNARQTNRGVLLQPPVQVSPSSQASWRLVKWSSSGCSTRCLQQLEQLARVRLTLGRRAYDVQVQLVLGPQAPLLAKEDAKRLAEQGIDVLKLGISNQWSDALLSQAGSVYIENPRGFLILGYNDQVKPTDIYHDIKHLLNIKE